MAAAAEVNSTAAAAANVSVVPPFLGCASSQEMADVCDKGLADLQDFFVQTNCTGADGYDHHQLYGLDKLKLICHGPIWTPEVTQRIVTLAIIMTLTLFGNLIIIIVLSCSKYRKLHKRVNIFIINLAIGDLTVCGFTMTTEVLFVVFEEAWVLGAAACKILLYVQMITLASTTFILTAMSLDRFMAICWPLSLGTNTSSRARKAILVAWVLAFIFASPQLLIFKQDHEGIYPDGEIKHICASRGYSAWWQRKLYFTFMATYILVIPTGVISYCYINVVRVVWSQGNKGSGVYLRKTVKDAKAVPKTKIKTIKMTLSIIGSFIICWTPYFVVHLIHIWSEYRYHIAEPVYVFAETLALLNSALNPILYGCFNIKLKRGLIEVFCPRRAVKEQTRNHSHSCVTTFATLNDNHAGGVELRKSGKRIAVPSGIRTPTGASTESASESRAEGSSSQKCPTRDNSASKNGYKYRVRFVGDRVEQTPHQQGQNKSLLSDYYDKEHR